jgi:hypothetical protein
VGGRKACYRRRVGSWYVLHLVLDHDSGCVSRSGSRSPGPIPMAPDAYPDPQASHRGLPFFDAVEIHHLVNEPADVACSSAVEFKVV